MSELQFPVECENGSLTHALLFIVRVNDPDMNDQTDVTIANVALDRRAAEVCKENQESNADSVSAEIVGLDDLVEFAEDGARIFIE